MSCPEGLRKLRATQKKLYGKDLELRKEDDRTTHPTLKEIEKTIKEKPTH